MSSIFSFAAFYRKTEKKEAEKYGDERNIANIYFLTFV